MKYTKNISELKNKMTLFQKVLNDNNVLTCAILTNILDIPLISVYIYRFSVYDSYYILDIVIHDSNVSVIRNECSNLLRSFLITKYLGTGIQNCETKYHVIQNGRIIATFNQNDLENSFDLENSTGYYWDCVRCNEIKNRMIYTNMNTSMNTSMNTNMNTSMNTSVNTKADIYINKNNESVSEVLHKFGLCPKSFQKNKTLEEYMNNYSSDINIPRRSFDRFSSSLL